MDRKIGKDPTEMTYDELMNEVRLAVSDAVMELLHGSKIKDTVEKNVAKLVLSTLGFEYDSRYREWYIPPAREDREPSPIIKVLQAKATAALEDVLSAPLTVPKKDLKEIKDSFRDRYNEVLGEMAFKVAEERAKKDFDVIVGSVIPAKVEVDPK